MHISIATEDWLHAQWGKKFYPDDLPDEWRLSYYANEFEAALLVKARRELLGKQFAEWCGDVGGRFQFIIETAHSESSSVFDALYQQCDKLVAAVDFCLTNDQYEFAQCSINVGSLVWKAGSLDEIAVLRVAATKPVTNRQLKELIEFVQKEFRQKSHVFLFFSALFMDAAMLNTLKTLSELMDENSA